MLTVSTLIIVVAIVVVAIRFAGVKPTHVALGLALGLLLAPTAIGAQLTTWVNEFVPWLVAKASGALK